MCGTIRRTLKWKTQLSAQIKFYKLMAVPVLVYGSEKWSLNWSNKRKIEPLEMKFLRPMAGYTLWDKKREENSWVFLILTTNQRNIKWIGGNIYKECMPTDFPKNV